MLGSYTAAQAVEAGWKTWASYHAHPVNLPVFKKSVDKTVAKCYDLCNLLTVKHDAMSPHHLRAGHTQGDPTVKLMRSRILVLQLAILSIMIFIPRIACADTTERVDLASDGRQAVGGSDYASISGDGRYVAFGSYSSDLVSDDTNGYEDIFVRDRLTSQTTRISVATNGTQGNNNSYSPSISADGRYVAFESHSSNLVSDDTNGYRDIFVRDRLTSQTTRISIASNGTQGDNFSEGPSISADGRFVAFESGASNLVPGNTNGWVGSIFVRDRQTGQTELVSIALDYTWAYGCSKPSISADGRYVAFESTADNLVPNDTSDEWGYPISDIFVRDRQTGQTERVSVTSGGAQGNNFSGWPSISADGRYVAFDSIATNLVPGDTNSVTDVFVHYRQTGQTERVSVASNGTQSNGLCNCPSISANGRFVAFNSYSASNLVPGDTNGCQDVFVRDRQTRQTERVSVASNGTQGNGDSGHYFNISISTDGQFVAFGSLASNLVLGDTNGQEDVFVRDRLVGGDLAVADDLMGLNSLGKVYYTTDKVYWVNIPGTRSKLVAGDFNGDSAYDIAGLSSTGKIYYTTNRSTWMNIPGTMSFLAAGDLNGNGSDDLAGLTSAGSIYYSTNKTSWMKISGTLTKLVTGDFDGNGADDLAGLTAAGKIYYSTNKASWANIPGACTSLTAGDFNGDGVDDIAVLTSAGSIYYTTNKSAWKNIPGTLVKLVTGDFNGDGKDDIAGLNSAGKVYYTTNKTSWANIPGALAGLVTGDFDGDGKDDIAGLSSSGLIYYTTNKSSWVNIPGRLSSIYSAR